MTKGGFLRVLIACLVVAAQQRQAIAAQATNRVSVGSGGSQASGDSYQPSLSADGRLVAFDSSAPDLVPGDGNGCSDVFVHDRLTGETTRVSVDSAGVEADGDCFRPALSADGRFVAFHGVAANLVAGDVNGEPDVFLHDRLTGVTSLVSASASGATGDGASVDASISGDGRFVSYTSWATNLVPGDANRVSDVFVLDRLTGRTTLASVTTAGAQGFSFSGQSAISADGKRVAFWSVATNLVPNDTNLEADIFVHDLPTGRTRRVSVNTLGMQAGDSSQLPAISGDGRFVAFQSRARNLVPGDTNLTEDIFVHDLANGRTIRVNVPSGGYGQANRISSGASISADGRYVAFSSHAYNLVPADGNFQSDVFVHDLHTRRTTRISVDSRGSEGNLLSGDPALSGDGDAVAYVSNATNLVLSDTNGAADCFAHDRVRLVLTRAGSCPGPITLAIRGAAPFGRVAIIHGPAGRFVKPDQPCAGLVVGIGSPVLAALLDADGAGGASLTIQAPAGACGLTVQAGDITTCSLSDPVQL